MTILTKDEISRLARAALDIHSAIAYDMYGSLAEAEDVGADEMVECSFDAHKIELILGDKELSDLWQEACRVDWEGSRAAVAAEVRRQWGW